MEAKMKSLMGAGPTTESPSSVVDDMYLKEVFLGKLTPEYKGSMTARIKRWLEGAGIS